MSMLNLIRIEFYRALKNKMLVIAIAIGCIISISHVLFVVFPLTQYLEESVNVGLLPHTVFNKWIGGETTSLPPTLFFILFPILACLPYADTYYADKKNGYIKNILIRTKRINYYFAKFLAVFVTGGIAILVPLLINLGMTALILPSIIPDSSTGFFSIFANSMWSDIYYSNPYLYIFMYLAIDFIFAGIFAVISLIFSDIVSNRFFVIISPFTIYIFILSISNLLGYHKYNPYIFLNPTQQAVGITFKFLLCVIIIAVSFCFAFFLIKGKKSEIY